MPDVVKGSLLAVTAKIRRDVNAVAPIAFSEVAARAVARSPVDTGAFRASWSASINASEAKPVEISAGSPLPARTDAAAVARRARPGDVLVFDTAQPYARPLEYGWSNQSSGMVRSTRAEWQAIVSAAAARARRG